VQEPQARPNRLVVQECLETHTYMYIYPTWICNMPKTLDFQFGFEA
jgi:hypothetical protein